MLINEITTTLPDGNSGSVGQFKDDSKKMYMLFDKIKLVKDKTYTFSIWIKSVENDSSMIVYEGTDDVSIYDLEADEWIKIEHTFKSNGKALNLEYEVGEYLIYQGQLEEGDTATEWEFSTADLNEAMAKTYTKATQTSTMFSWLVDDNFSQTNVQLSAEAYIVASKYIKLKGDNIELDGDTKIGDGFTLTADNIDVNSLFAKEINTKMFKLIAEKGIDKSNIQMDDAVLFDVTEYPEGGGAFTKARFYLSKDGASLFSNGDIVITASGAGNSVVIGSDVKFNQNIDFGDTWQNLAINSVFTENDTFEQGGIACKKIANHVFLTISVAKTARFQSQIKVATLPEGYRPKKQIWFETACTGNRRARWRIYTAGDVYLENVYNGDGTADTTTTGLIFAGHTDFWID